MAQIQFIRGVTEEVVPDVRLTRSKDGNNGKAIFYFEHPQLLQEGNLDILGMYLVDEEGELISREVNAKFVNGQPTAIEAIYAMKSSQEWDRFMRFMERYAKTYGLAFNQAEA